MCNVREVRHASRRAALGALGILLMPAVALGAQTSADLDARMAVMRDSIKATQARVDFERSQLLLQTDDSLVVDGVTVFFPRAGITAQDQNTLRDGIAAATQALKGRFGAGSERLLQGDRWSVLVGRQSRNGVEYATFVEGRGDGYATGRAYALPLAADGVTDYVLSRAGARLLQRDPVLGAFAAGAFSFELDERPHYVAQVQLATSTSTVARRCGERVIRACRTILDPRESAQWFLPTDSVRRNGQPIPRGVNGSLVGVAIEMGGLKAIDAIGEPHGLDEPVAILAKAAGVTPDSLLTTWGARLRAAAVSRATPSVSFAAIAVAWWGIFLLAATRRRPR